MGETRQKKPSKRSVKASQALGRNTGKSLILPASDTQTLVEAPSILSTELGGLSVQIEGCGAYPCKPADASLLDVRKTVGKGIGVFAARKIPAGTLVIAEIPLIRLTRAQEHSCDGDDEALKEYSIRQQYNALPAALRKGYDKLFDTEKAQFSRPKSIFYSNCYNLDHYSDHGGACIGLLASRINHACGGHNIQFSFVDDACLGANVNDLLTDESDSATSRASLDSERPPGLILMHAIKDIPKGKELLSNYLSPYMVSQTRQNELQMHYKFTCDCSACMQQGFWADSDERRSQMRRCRAIIKRSEARVRTHLNAREASNEAKPERSEFIVMQEAASAIEALNKLANLLVKEGLCGYDLASTYHDLAKWSSRNNDENSRRRWMAKARELSILCFGQGSKQVADADRALQ